MVVEAWVSRSHRFPREKRRNEEKEKDAVLRGYERHAEKTVVRTRREEGGLQSGMEKERKRR